MSDAVHYGGNHIKYKFNNVVALTVTTQPR